MADFKNILIPFTWIDEIDSSHYFNEEQKKTIIWNVCKTVATGEEILVGDPLVDSHVERYLREVSSMQAYHKENSSGGRPEFWPNELIKALKLGNPKATAADILRKLVEKGYDTLDPESRAVQNNLRSSKGWKEAQDEIKGRMKEINQLLPESQKIEVEDEPEETKKVRRDFDF